MLYKTKRPPLDPCPLEEVLAMIAGKWKVRILYLLSLNPASFALLRRSLPGIKQQVLSTQLKQLCSAVLVAQTRTSLGKSGFSTYTLTPLGHGLIQILSPLAEWGQQRLAEHGRSWTAPPIPKPKVQQRNT